MENDVNLFNAAVIGENPEEAFVVLDGHLHAVDRRVAALKAEKSDPAKVLPLVRGALKALIEFAGETVEPHFLNVDWNVTSNNQQMLISKLTNIYMHLPRYERNKLVSMIHHAAA
jgi:hypothetical protein